MYIKTGDTVQIIAGKDRGKTGTVFRVDHRRNRVYVEGANLVKRHQKPTPVDSEGGIIEKEAPIHASNVLLYSETLERGVRVSYRYVGEGGAHFANKAQAKASFSEPPAVIEKVRVCAKTGEVF